MGKNRFTYPLSDFQRFILFCCGLGFVFFFNTNLQAQTYHHLQLSGFNQDVIAEYKPASNSTTKPIDWDGNPAPGYEDWYHFALPTHSVVQSINSNSTAGIPENGLINSQTIPGLTFQLQPFDENNSLRLESTANQDYSLEVNNAVPLQKLYLLVTSGDGEVKFNLDIKFNDNTTYSVGPYEVPDWTDSNPSADIAFEGTAGVSRLINDFLRNENPPKDNLYQFEIDLLPAHYEKIITEIIFKPGYFPEGWFGYGYFNVFAVTGLELSDCAEPITVSASDTLICSGVPIVLEATGYPTIYFQDTDPEGEHDDLGGAIVEVDEPGTYYFRAYDETEDCWGTPIGIHIFSTYGPENISASAVATEVCIGNDIELLGNADYPVLNNTIYEANDYSQFQYWTTHYKYENHNEWDLNYMGASPLGTAPLMRYDYADNYTGYQDVKNYVQSPSINASAYSNISVQFRHYLKDRNNHTLGDWEYSIKAEISKDNITWETLYNSGIPDSDIGPQTLTYNLSSSYNYQPFYLRFVVEGDETGMWHWDIDDIKITGNATATMEYSWSGPNGFTSNQQNPIIPNAGINDFGEYILTVGYGTCYPTQSVTVSIKQCEAYINPQIRKRIIN